MYKNPKSEYRNPKQTQNSNVQNSKRFGHLNFCHSNIVSDLGFRASNLIGFHYWLRGYVKLLHLVILTEGFNVLKLFLSLRYLQKKKIVLLCITAVALTVALLIVVDSLFSGPYIWHKQKHR